MCVSRLSARSAGLTGLALLLLVAKPAHPEMPAGTWPGSLTFADDGQHDDLELVVGREGATATAVLKHGGVDHVLTEVRNSDEGLAFAWGDDRCSLEDQHDGTFSGSCKNDKGTPTVSIEVLARPAQPHDAGGAEDDSPPGNAEPKPANPHPAPAPAPDGKD